MGVHTFEDLLSHRGHDVRVNQYVTFDDDGEMSVLNVAIECEECYTVLIDFENPKVGKTVKIKRCSTCGSKEVFYDAYVGVNDESDVRTFDSVFCETCGGQTSWTEGDEALV